MSYPAFEAAALWPIEKRERLIERLRRSLTTVASACIGSHVAHLGPHGFTNECDDGWRVWPKYGAPYYPFVDVNTEAEAVAVIATGSFAFPKETAK